uniref:Mitochondrial import inner membrane translocase subunit TIM23 n=1 Tax=Strigamia maritima TaxID=126957 RepID=T1INU8_STRMM
MDKQNSNLFNSLPTPSPNLNSISPYLNFDPAVLNQGGPEFIFPEGAARQRGRFELAFSQIGGSVMTGAFLGSVNGLYTGLKETSIAGHTGSVRRTQVLNFITKRGAVSANALGVVALMYSGFGVILSLVRGTDDELNTVTASTLTGLLYKGTAGVKKCALGGAVGCGLGVAYVLWTSKDRLRDMLPMSNY